MKVIDFVVLGGTLGFLIFLSSLGFGCELNSDVYDEGCLRSVALVYCEGQNKTLRENDFSMNDGGGEPYFGCVDPRTHSGRYDYVYFLPDELKGCEWVCFSGSGNVKVGRC